MHSLAPAACMKSVRSSIQLGCGARPVLNGLGGLVQAHPATALGQILCLHKIDVAGIALVCQQLWRYLGLSSNRMLWSDATLQQGADNGSPCACSICPGAPSVGWAEVLHTLYTLAAAGAGQLHHRHASPALLDDTQWICSS